MYCTKWVLILLNSAKARPDKMHYFVYYVSLGTLAQQHIIHYNVPESKSFDKKRLQMAKSYFYVQASSHITKHTAILLIPAIYNTKNKKH